MNLRSFAKYRTSGAYHWQAIGRHPLWHHCFTRERYRLAIELARPRRGERAIDVGCGDGAFLALLQRAGTQVTGIEPDRTGRELAARELAKRRIPAEILPDLNAVPPASQDLAVSLEVIEHVPEPERFLQDIARVLQPSGRAVISTPIRLTESPLDVEHEAEFFPAEFRAHVERVLTVEEHRQAIPVFAEQLVNWRPWLTLRLPLVRVVFNILDGWLNVPILRRLQAPDLYPTHQVILARKRG